MNATSKMPDPNTQKWNEQFATLKARYPHASNAVLVALHIITQNPDISVDDAKAQANLHGTRITAASVNGARKLLANAAAATPTSSNAAPMTTPAPRRAARRVRAAEPSLDAAAKLSQAVTRDTVPQLSVGPNGHRVGYTEAGDMVEWVPGDKDGEEEWPLLLRRNDQAIQSARDEFWDRVWWVRHKVRDAKGKAWPNAELREHARAAADEIERRYGRESLVLDDFEFGMLNGRLSTLAWVLGSEWGESLDT